MKSPHMLTAEQVKREYVAILARLVKRATWLDKWRARTRPAHWLNEVRRTLEIECGTSDSDEYCRRLMKEMMEEAERKQV